MGTVELLTDDVPLSHLYGHPKGVYGADGVERVRKADKNPPEAKGSGRPVRSVRSQWSVEKDVKRANSWYLRWEVMEFAEYKVWKKAGCIFWMYSQWSTRRDGKVHKSTHKSVASFIRELNA